MSSYADPTVISVGKTNRLHLGTILMVCSAALVILVAVFFLVQSMIANSEADRVRKQTAIDQATKDSLKPVSDELVVVNNQARDLHTLFDNQTRWEFVLNEVENHLYKNMAVTSLQLSDQGTGTLSGTTSDYVSYAKLFQSMTDSYGQKAFSNVHPTTITKEDATDGKPADISFTLNVVLNPSVLKLQQAPQPEQ